MQLNLRSMKGFSYISFLASSGSKKGASFKGSVSERKWLTPPHHIFQVGPEGPHAIVAPSLQQRRAR